MKNIHKSISNSQVNVYTYICQCAWQQLYIYYELYIYYRERESQWESLQPLLLLTKTKIKNILHKILN